MSIAEKIRAARREIGITQNEAARRLGTSRQNYAQYENGARIPKIETLLKLAEALECRPEDIADYEHFPYLDFRPGLFDPYADGEPTEEEAKLIIDEINLSERSALVTARVSIEHDLYLLNRSGLDKAVERVHELTEVPRYRNDTGSASSPAPAETKEGNTETKE